MQKNGRASLSKIPFYNSDLLFWISSLFISIFLIFFSLKNPIYKFQGENLCRKKKYLNTQSYNLAGKGEKEKIIFYFYFSKKVKEKKSSRWVFKNLQNDFCCIRSYHIILATTCIQGTLNRGSVGWRMSTC